MPLTLTLSGPAVPRLTKALTSGTLSIGRGAGNDWVLPDPERHLSKTHCVISVENGRTVLTDLSTNGVYVNGAQQPTQRDSRIVLTDGDDFRIGEYTVRLAEGAQAASGHGGAGYAAPGYGTTLPDPFAEPDRRGAAEGRSPLDIDPLDDPLGRPPDPAFRHPVAHTPAARRPEDPFDVSDDKQRRSVDPDDDLFRGTKPAIDWQGPSQPDNADAPKHAFAPARVIHPADPSGIDFDALIGDLSSVMPAQPASPARPAPPPPRPAPAPDPFADLDNLLAPTPPQPPPRPQPLPRPQPALAPDDSLGETGITPPPRPVAAPVPPASVPQTATGDARAGLAAFLEGAGVANLPASGTDPEETLRAVGQVFRAMTEGLREVLMSRSAIKGEMRVEQTMIRARDNNALKFSVTVDDAVAALLSANRAGYMPPLVATKEAFNDLKSHELAVMAGVQTALMALLQRFDPTALESRLAQGLLGSVLPAARKARYWDSFRQTYGDIAREAEDDFQAVFGREFARAYTAQTRKE